MNTIASAALFAAATRLRGFDPLTAGLSATQRAEIAESCTEWLRRGWEADWWPELMRVEQRRYRLDYDAARTYSADDEVWAPSLSTYVRSLADANRGNDPADTDYWEPCFADMILSIEFLQEGRTRIGGIDAEDCCYDEDPRRRPYAPRRQVLIYHDAFMLRPARLSAPLEPWIRFRLEAPTLSWTDWDGAAAYAIGDTCFHGSHSYRALAATTGEAPDAHPDAWARVEVPRFLFDYVRHGVASYAQHEDEGRYKEQALAERELVRLAEQLIDAQTPDARRASFRSGR